MHVSTRKYEISLCIHLIKVFPLSINILHTLENEAAIFCRKNIKCQIVAKQKFATSVVSDEATHNNPALSSYFFIFELSKRYTFNNTVFEILLA